MLRADLPLFEWGRDQGLSADPVVRRLVRLRRISPALASVYAELLGLGGRHGEVPMHQEIREQFFANREPSVREWQELRGAGVALVALCRPYMVLAGMVVVDGPAGFSFAAKATLMRQRAFLIAVKDEDGRFLDIAAWQPAKSWVGLWLGRAWALGQARVHAPRLGEEGALPVWRSPLNWLRAGREGIVLIRPGAAAYFLDDAGPLLAEDMAHASELRRLLTRTGPRILVRAPDRRAA